MNSSMDRWKDVFESFSMVVAVGGRRSLRMWDRRPVSVRSIEECDSAFTFNRSQGEQVSFPLPPYPEVKANAAAPATLASKLPPITLFLTEDMPGFGDSAESVSVSSLELRSGIEGRLFVEDDMTIPLAGVKC